MIRLEIPCKNDMIDDALGLARKFITDLDQVLSADDAEYLFGKKTNNAE